MLQKEGQVRIPAGCAISGIFHKDGTRENGTRIIDSIRTMHDRSNGLGGGFAGYGIYPEYADYYAFHVFYDTQAAKEECEREIERHFDIVNLSKIPTRRHPHQSHAERRLHLLLRQEHGRFQGKRLPRGRWRVLHAGKLRGLLLDLPWPLSDQHTGLVGAARTRSRCLTPRSFTTARFPLMMQTAASLRCSATPATC